MSFKEELRAELEEDKQEWKPLLIYALVICVVIGGMAWAGCFQ